MSLACHPPKGPSPARSIALYTEGFSHFVTSMTAPIATGRSERGRAGFAPAGKAPTLHGARRTPGHALAKRSCSRIVQLSELNVEARPVGALVIAQQAADVEGCCQCWRRRLIAGPVQRHHSEPGDHTSNG